MVKIDVDSIRINPKLRILRRLFNDDQRTRHETKGAI